MGEYKELGAKRALTEQELIEWATAGPAKRGLSIDTVERLIWQNARLTKELAEAREALEQRHNDIGILIAMIESLEEATGEGPEEEDGVIFWQIRQSHNEAIDLRRAAKIAGDRADD